VGAVRPSATPDMDNPDRRARLAEDDAHVGDRTSLTARVEELRGQADRKGSASSDDHWISVTGVGNARRSDGRSGAGFKERMTSAVWPFACARVSRTAQTWRRSDRRRLRLRAHDLFEDEYVAGLKVG